MARVRVVAGKGSSEEAMETQSADSGRAESSWSSEVGSSTPDTPTDNEQGMCGLSELVSSCLSKSRSSPPHDSAFAPASLQSPIAKFNSLDAPPNSKDPQPFLRASLFTGVPPVVRFYTKGTKVTKPNKKICARLTWCYNSLLPIVMRHSLAVSHFTVVDENLFYVGYWGRHLKSAQYRSLHPYQKVNHYPGAFHIGRKDRLWMHIHKQQERFGEVYEIIPKTYILPDEREELLEYIRADPKHHVILKPPASARGTGISVTRKVKEIPTKGQLLTTKTQMIAQQYIARPLTINGAKFDLRFYVYVPSLEPLRIYIYEEGLVRFASVPYSKNLATVSNKYMHLTNYSINKLAEKDGVSEAPVPKWTFSHLTKYFENEGIDWPEIRAKIEDTIVKAFIACEKPIRDHMVKHINHGFVCHELFGIDILLDEDLKPWLLEVNISPSLHSGTPLDVSVKAPLAKDVLNMAGIYVPPSEEKMEEADYSTRPRNWPKPADQQLKERLWIDAYLESLNLDPKILKRLTPEDVRMLVEFEDERLRSGNFRILFPLANTAHYLPFFVEPVYANLLLQQWQIEMAEDRSEGIERLERLCKQGHINKRDGKFIGGFWE